MGTLLQDLRYAARLLAKRPGFTLVAVLTLALGIGANAAIFSVVNAVLIRPLPFHDPDRLMIIWEDASFVGFPRNTPAPANYVDWKAQNSTFEDMAAVASASFNITGDGEPQRVEAHRVSANLIPLLGVQPALGRAFTEEEDRPGNEQVAIISHGLWSSRFGGQPSAVGGRIMLDDRPYTIVGVMPPRFQFLSPDVDIWVPMALTPQQLANRNSHFLQVVGRLKPGVSYEQAQADMQNVMRGLAQAFPDAVGQMGILVVPLREELAGDMRRPLMMLLVAVAFVLLIACANIASLLLARVTSRSREIAVRLALGASRARLIRQLLTESVLLSLVGGLVGLGLAWWSFAFLQNLIPPGLSAAASPQLDIGVLGYTLLVALITGVVFGLAPALQASRADLHDTLKQSGGRGAIGGRHRRLQSVFVVSEVALAIVLLIGAGLLIQTLQRLLDQYSGMRLENVLTLNTTLSQRRYDTFEKRTAFYDQVLERVGALPGVVSAGYTTAVPLVWKGGTNSFAIEGQPAEPGQVLDANHRQVSRDYLKTLGIPIRQGRDFNATDTAGSQPVAIVNETMARTYFNGEAVGKRINFGGNDSQLPWVEIVGVAGDVRQMGVEAPIKAEVYVPYQQANYFSFYAPRDLVVRTSGEPLDLAAAVRREIRAVDPDQPVSDVRTMEDVLGEEVTQRRIGMMLLTGFAGLALLLASIGIYGIIAFYVAQRTQEIGVRMALGARPLDILRLVFGRGLALALAGVVLGLGTALALTRLMQSLLFGIGAADPLTFASVALLVVAVALLACYVPARRATRVDPMEALRYE